MIKEITKIDELKFISYNILKFVADFCEINNIKYYLFAGTLLGAIRHEGFIPWDDDIDIAIPRDDYEKFIIEFDRNNDVNYKVLSIENSNKYYLPYAKVIDNRTLLFEDGKESMPIGVFIDIFPLDSIPDKSCRLFWNTIFCLVILIRLKCYLFQNVDLYIKTLL